MFSPPLRGKLLKKILDLNKPGAEFAEIKFFVLKISPDNINSYIFLLPRG
jgi:hypothetical protein